MGVSHEVTDMEIDLMNLLQFEVYGAEPMAFIQRFLKAASLGTSTYGLELSTFFMDSMLSDLNIWAQKTQLKAAASVFTTLLLLKWEDMKNIQDIWTPNMEYYVWHDYGELLPMANHLLKNLSYVLPKADPKCSLTAKYMSKSRHHGLLTQD